MEQPPTARRSLGRNLPIAIASGVALAVLFLGTLAWHPLAFLSFIMILVVIALYELDTAFRSRDLRPATLVAAGAGFVMMLGAYQTGASGQALGLVLLVIGAMAWALLDRERVAPSASVGATVLMGVWVPFLVSFLGLLLARPYGPWYVAAAVAISVFNDIGAFAVGMKLGRHKMAPSVSPAKSWEGFAGGLAAALMLAGVFGALLPDLTIGTGLALGAVVALVSTVGDLSESLVKRDLGVKDMGRIVPGHGGIMDRADAIIFAIPAAHFCLRAFGL